MIVGAHVYRPSAGDSVVVHVDPFLERDVRTLHELVKSRELIASESKCSFATMAWLADASAIKAMVTAVNAVLKGQRFEDEELMAEGGRCEGPV